MNRRNFLLNFLLWIVSFIFGYRVGNSNIKSGVLSEELAEIEKKSLVSVTDFGAKGDDATNDTTAFQNAINSLPAGGTVFVPSGTFIVDTITLPSKVELRGANGGTSIIQMSSNATTHLIKLATVKTYKCSLRNLYIKGIPTLPYDLVHFVNDGLGPDDNFVDHYHSLDNCIVEKSGRHGVYIDGSRENNIQYLKISESAGYGFYYKNSHDSKISTITASYSDVGIFLENASTVKMIQCKGFGCTEGLKMIGASNNSFVSCEFQNNLHNGVTLINCERVMFKNLMCDTNGETDGDYNEIVLNGCKSIRIDGYLKSEPVSKVNTFINFVNSINDININMLYITSQSRKIAFLNSGGLVDASTHVIIAGREIYNNNIINPNLVISIANDVLDGFSLEQATGIVYTSSFDGTAQNIKITSNGPAVIGTKFIGIKTTIDVSKISKLSVACVFEGGSLVDEDYYIIRTESYMPDYEPSIDTKLITTHTGDRTLALTDIAVPSVATTMDIYCEIGVKHSLLRNYKIKNPKIMIGSLR